MNPNLDLTKKYVDLSNKAKLPDIYKMLHQDVLYRSTQMGDFKGINEVSAMMDAFYKKFPDAFWNVERYLELSPEQVCFDFIMKGKDSGNGEVVERVGREHLVFDQEGLITQVRVMVMPREEL